jgi:hypothetical protein
MSMNLIRSPYPSGPAAFSPLDVSGIDWWPVADDATIDGVPQFDWPDRSPANRQYGQNTAANEPTLVSGPNGHQLVQLGVNKWLVPDPTSRTLAVANTLIAVASKSTVNSYLISGTEAGIHGSPAIISGFNNSGVKDFEYYNDFGGGNIERAAFAASTDSNLHILIITRTDNTGNVVGYFDGGSPAFTIPVNNNCDWNGLAFSRIGSQHTASSTNYTGKAGQFLHWPSIVSKADLNLLGTYLGTYYSIAWTSIP